MANTEERRCKARTKAGRPCKVRLVNAAGYCVAHDPEQPADMRELGRASGRSRRGLGKMPAAERQSLREYLREQVDPSEVWLALKAALESGSQTAVVSAARLLVTELYEERPDEDRKADMQRANAQAKQRLAELLANRARADEPRRIRDLLEELGERLQVEAVDEHPDLIAGDVGAERAAAILAKLQERGLIVPRDRFEEMAEARALELLAAMKQDTASSRDAAAPPGISEELQAKAGLTARPEALGKGLAWLWGGPQAATATRAAATPKGLTSWNPEHA